MPLLKRIPVTIILITINLLVFIYCRVSIGTFNDPTWTQGLLFRGAEFAPLSLDDEWYRIFTHLFMHGSILHLLLNMYALSSVGSEIEQLTGTRKFLFIYFLTGLSASLGSLYFNLFTVGVGASGAIFGLFGFSLIVQLSESRKRGHSMVPIIINFVVFVLINLIFARALSADNFAHAGGLLGGLLLGATSLIDYSFKKVRMEFFFLVLFILFYFSLPRYQVTYFKFFQKVLNIEDSTSALLTKNNLTDEEFTKGLQRQINAWNNADSMLRSCEYLPKGLSSDTFKLKRYMRLQKQSLLYRIEMIRTESYRYMDSIEFTREKIQDYLPLEHPLSMMRPIHEFAKDPMASSRLIPGKVWYDEEWVELDGPPGKYYRMGMRDSFKRWQGLVRDFYENGIVQMKGVYHDNLRNGIFFYYSDHNTYTSSGRYMKDKHVGRWEQFYGNGVLQSVEYFNDDYFVQSVWDSLGGKQVTNGIGHCIRWHSSGAIAEEGDFQDGKKNGVWTGRFADGNLHYEEYFNHGWLIRGRSNNKGEQFLYDRSSLSPMPVGGNDPLMKYLTRKKHELASPEHGTVIIRFRVSVLQKLSEFEVGKSLSPKLDSIVIEWIKRGPKWIPARDHGHGARSAYGRVNLEF